MKKHVIISAHFQMKSIALLSLSLVLLLACKNESKKLIHKETDITQKSEQSRLHKFQKDGLEIIDTTISFFEQVIIKPKFTAKFKMDGIILFLCEYSEQLSDDFKINDFVLYDGTNGRPLIIPQLTAASYELIDISPNPKFIIKAYLPDSRFFFKTQNYIEQNLVLGKGEIKFINQLIYSPPIIPNDELDSLIKQYGERENLDRISKDTSQVVDGIEMYFIKIFLASINGNKKCEDILYNLTNKFIVDGAIAESYADYVYLDELLKNKNIVQFNFEK
jgi:hypothetical protein